MQGDCTACDGNGVSIQQGLGFRRETPNSFTFWVTMCSVPASWVPVWLPKLARATRAACASSAPRLGRSSESRLSTDPRVHDRLELEYVDDHPAPLQKSPIVILRAPAATGGKIAASLPFSALSRPAPPPLGAALFVDGVAKRPQHSGAGSMPARAKHIYHLYCLRKIAPRLLEPAALMNVASPSQSAEDQRKPN